MKIQSLPYAALVSGLLLLAAALPAAAQEKEETPDTLDQKPLTVLDKILDRVTFSGILQGGYSAGFGSVSPIGITMGNGANDFSIHRLVFKVEAKVTDNLSLTYMSDLAGGYTNLEYYVEYTPVPEFGIVLGQKKVPFLMDNQISPAVHELISTMSFLSNYMVACNPSNPLNGAWSGRDLGVEIKGDLLGKIMSYRIGAYNGQGMNRRDLNKSKTLSGSLTIRPFGGLELQGSFLSGKTVAVGDALFVKDRRRVTKGESYRMDRVAGGLAYKSERFGIRSEYIAGRDGNVLSDGVYATARVLLFKKLDLIGSYTYADFNKGGENHLSINNYVVGLQYKFLPKCRLSLEYNVMDPQGASNTNHMINTQLQFAF